MRHYLLTGATGYIGSMLAEYLSAEAGAEKDSQITAIVRDLDKASEMLPQEVKLVQADLEDAEKMRDINGEFTHILHCASITKSSEMKEHPVEVTKSIVNATQNILELAKRCGIESVVMLSSMEVYGEIDCSDGHRVEENEVSAGVVELMNVRSCYPLAKRMAENLCYSYWKEYGVPVKVARLAQTFGRGILPQDSRVFAQFAHAAVEKKDIVLHTEGNSMGNYCSIDDAVSGILLLLENGENGEAYNIVNEENTMMIRQVAELVAQKIADGKIQIRYEIPKENVYGYAADTGLRLSSEKLRQLGWTPSKNLEQMFLDAIETMTSWKILKERG